MTKVVEERGIGRGMGGRGIWEASSCQRVVVFVGGGSGERFPLSDATPETLWRGPKSGYSCQHLVQRKGSPSTLQPEHTHEVWWREASRITIRPSEELLRLPGLLVVFTL